MSAFEIIILALSVVLFGLVFISKSKKYPNRYQVRLRSQEKEEEEEEAKPRRRPASTSSGSESDKTPAGR